MKKVIQSLSVMPLLAISAFALSSCAATSGPGCAGGCKEACCATKSCDSGCTDCASKKKECKADCTKACCSAKS
ncbi:hypothetical protein JIN77_09575 [Verrucomicrobiaceae bacterium R5-34]|nr:hypothetical protein [Verrucomicrobiaceae bacterium R5-34]